MNQKFEVNFLCVGFEKCATTTLDAVLRQHSGIALPKIKELHLIDWYMTCNNLQQVIRQKFFESSQYSRQVGIVDHTLSDCPRLVRRYFGKDVKLIFMLRNPIDRLFSFYKMALWLGYPVVYESTLFGKEITNVQKSFERYVFTELARKQKSDDILRGRYIDKILKFYQYYDRDRMKFIFFEDYISNPQKSIMEILDFLELPYEDMDISIWEYRGNMISKNNLCFKVNRKLSVNFDKARCNPKATAKQFDRAYGFFLKACKFTTVNTNEKMNNITRERLEEYYRESIRQLEEFLDTDLSQRWV